MATRNIVPRATSEGSLGTSLKKWLSAFIDTLTLTNPLTVPNGGTGKATNVAYSVQCGGTTSTGACQDVGNVGSAAQVLTSNGAGQLPSWQAVPAQDIGKCLMAAQGYNVTVI
jgi:hypothetical protein